MTEDARQSLIALAAVSLFFGTGYFTIQLLKTVELPRWLPAVGLALNVATIGWWLIAHGRRRRRGRSNRK